MPSWCQSEASVIAPHLTDNVVSGERRVRGRLCVRVRALAGSDHKASLVPGVCSLSHSVSHVSRGLCVFSPVILAHY